MVDHGINKSYLLPTSRDETAEGKSAIKENMNRTGKSDVNACTISKSLKETSFAVSDGCKMRNNSSASQLQQPSPREEDAGSRKSIIARPCLNKRGSDFHSSSNGANIGYNDKVMFPYS